MVVVLLFQFNKFNKLLFLLLLVQNLFALTENDFVNKVLEQNRFLLKDKIYTDIKKVKLAIGKQEFEDFKVNLNIINSYSYYDIDKDTDSTDIYSKNKIDNQQTLKLTIAKKFLSVDGIIDFSVSKTVPDKNISRYKQNIFYDKYIINNDNISYKLSYKYPLLKPDTTANEKKIYQHNVLNVDKEKLDFLDAKERFLASMLNDYLLWAKYQEIANIYNDYKIKLQQINNTDNAVNIAIDIINIDIIKNNANLLSTKKKIASILDDDSLLNTKINFNYNKNIKLITTKQRIASFLAENNRKLLKIIIKKKLKQIDLKYYKQQTLPQLDFSAAITNNIYKGNTLSSKYNNNSINYKLSLEFNMPIGENLSNKKNLLINRLNLKEIIITYNDTLNDLIASIEGINLNLRLMQGLIDKYKQTIIDLTKNSNKQLVNYKQSIITIKELLYTYLQQKNELVKYINTVISYRLKIVQYDNYLDRLLLSYAVIN